MKKTMLYLAAAALGVTAVFACSPKTKTAEVTGNRWTDEEKALIWTSDSVMRVLTIDNQADSLVLRDTCREFTDTMLMSQTYSLLAANMVATVTDPANDGVGIAGPQVGISRRVIAVQRFDKEGEPFEVYPNVRIMAMQGEPEPGVEGCLSIPDRRDTVMRQRTIYISYKKVNGDSVKDTTELVTGFTAVIFQHECDHLDGILYIDRL